MRDVKLDTLSRAVLVEEAHALRARCSQDKRVNTARYRSELMTANGDEPPPFEPLGKGRFVSKQTFVFGARNGES
jgi:hypothetical protein